jgi:dihydrolipoamide dehydrogenase
MVMGSLRQEAEVAIIGAGPGGYVAALRAADLGKEVVLIEERARLGGVCLLEGCIPSKTLIHAVELCDSARAASAMGLTFRELRIDPRKLRQWTESVIDGLALGVEALIARRGVHVIHGRARFGGEHSLAIEGSDVSAVDFRDCIVATGSHVQQLPAARDLPVWSSADALELREIPARLLVVGGGFVGLELGLVYAGLGSEVALAEFFPALLPGADADLVSVLVRSCERRLRAIHTNSKVDRLEHAGGKFVVTIEKDGATFQEEFDQVLLAVGRKPNTGGLGLETVGIELDDAGRIPVDEQCRTALAHIYAIGDVVPGPMLAHKASREAKVAAETIADHPAAFDNRAIPAVVYTDPELAWVGLTERQAREEGVRLDIGRFPLSALGRARTMGRTDGMVKVLAEKETGLVVGVGMVGPNASELIAEGTLAIEMGASLEDLMVTIHPHPTISEAILEVAEAAAGSPTHLNPRGR